MPASASEHLKKTFASRLRAARGEMTQPELARRCGWAQSQSRISMYEGGKRWPSLDHIIKLAEVLEVSAQYLIFGDDAAKPHEPKPGRRLLAQHKYLDEQLAILEKLIRLPEDMQEALEDAITAAYGMAHRKSTRRGKEPQST